MSPEDQRAYVVRKAQTGQLAQDDQHWQAVVRRARQGVRADQNTQDDVNRVGGAHNGSASSWI